jgi:hypothetical protein
MTSEEAFKILEELRLAVRLTGAENDKVKEAIEVLRKKITLTDA